MNSHDDKQNEFGDRQVAREYSAWSDERTPPELDRRILTEARQAVHDSAGVRSAWFRPLAFAATLVLGVALLFEMRPEFEPGTPESLPDVTSPQETRRPADNRREPGGGIRKPAVQGLEPTPAAITAPRQKAQQRTGPAISNDQDRHCRTEQVVDAEVWWQCIEALRAAGDADAAAAELHRLRERFPDFRPDP